MKRLTRWIQQWRTPPEPKVAKKSDVLGVVFRYKGLITREQLQEVHEYTTFYFKRLQQSGVLESISDEQARLLATWDPEQNVSNLKILFQAVPLGRLTGSPWSYCALLGQLVSNNGSNPLPVERVKLILDPELMGGDSFNTLSRLPTANQLMLLEKLALMTRITYRYSAHLVGSGVMTYVMTPPSDMVLFSDYVAELRKVVQEESAT